MMPTNSTATAISIQEILRNALDGIFVIDRQRRFILFSEGCERITGYTSTELLGAECLCRDVLDCRDEYDRPLSSALCPVKAIFDGAAGSSRQKMRLRRKNGAYVWVETNYTPVNNETGDVEFVLGVIRDITESKAREDTMLDQFTKIRQRLHELAPNEQFEADLSELRSLPGSKMYSTTGQESPWTQTGTSAAGRPAPSGLTLDPILADVEREAIRRALRSANWQRNKAAQLMGISRSRLYRRMEALGIDPNRRE